MKYGLSIFATGETIRPDVLARAAEERGFEALFFPEHTHIPASRRTPYPLGGELPKEYWCAFDPFVALSMAAAVTTRLKVGTGICLVVERDPIILAKEVASLDFLSGGRFLFGIGAGWNVEEMENHGTNFATRWKLLRERIEAMKSIWTQEDSAYRGDLVRFDSIWSGPKPLQKPHPPILLGGHGKKALQRVIRYCDGWMPIGPMVRDFAAAMRRLREFAQQSGRDPNAISVTATSAPPDKKVLATWAAAGVERAVFPLPPAPADVVLRQLDRYATLM